MIENENPENPTTVYCFECGEINEPILLQIAKEKENAPAIILIIPKT